MIMEQPRIPRLNQYPAKHFEEFAKRDQQILDSFRSEYERRLEDEAAEVQSHDRASRDACRLRGLSTG